MNRIYRSIWNDKTGTFVAASEHSKSNGKRSSPGASALAGGAHFALKGLALSLMLAFGSQVYAGPTGGVVAAGSASIAGTAGKTTINQASQNVAINWQGFSIGQNEAVQFVQPNSSSVALNRVLGPDPSNILGSLSANGKVFLLNANGILFGKGSQVNVGGLVASTLNLSDSDFMAGKYNFAGASNAAVLNQGSINADGGYVALLGASVSNEGVISARLGSVALAAGNAITLDVAGDGLLNVTVNQGAVNALAQNGGLIQADGGQVLLTAQAAGTLLQSAVNNSGVIQAQTVENRNGTIRLMGDMHSGSVNVGGTLDASAPNGGNGGFIETSAARVKIADNASITTQSAMGKSGTWLIDPVDFTIEGTGDISGPALSGMLELNSVVISTVVTGADSATNLFAVPGQGSILVNEAVSWTAPQTLTLNAQGGINVRAGAAITGVNGSLVANANTGDISVNAATKTTTGNLTFNAPLGDVNLNAATTVVTGNLTSTAGKNVNVTAASTVTTGNNTSVAAGNVNVSAAMTVTTGDIVLRGDNDGTGPGAAAGTVGITCGNNCLTITTGALRIRFNPASYAATAAEITAYAANLTGGGSLDAKAWVFGKGDNKLYDGTTTATVSGLKPDVLSVAPPVVLGAVTAANFDTKHVGTNKPITYNTTFNDAVYDLFAPFGTAVGTYLTRADILVRPLTVNAVTDTRVYNGTTSSTGIPTSTGLQAGDTLNGPLTQAYANKDVLGAGNSILAATGPYTVTDGNGGNNYTLTVNTAPGTITPAPLTILANDNTKVYGQTFTPATTAFTLPVPPVAGETVTGVVETSTGSAPTANVAGSPYPIVITPGSATGTFTASNYTITLLNGALTVTRAPLTLKANDNTKVYGQTFTPASTAFTMPVPPQNGETVTGVTETSTGSAPTASVAGSTYPIVITPGSETGTITANNYTITYQTGALAVTPAPLTLKANDNTKVYGQTFTPASTAFTMPVPPVNGETVTGVTETSTGSPPTASVAGSTYPIVITPGSETGTITASNYTITYQNGALTVTPAPLTLKANDNTKVYGQTFTPATTAFTVPVPPVNGETVTGVAETSTGSAPTASVAGSTYPIVITPGSATGTIVATNYTITYLNGALTVTPAPLTIRANDNTKVYGQTFTPAGTAFTTPVAPQNGETVGSVTEVSPAGTPPTAAVPGPYAITPSAATGGTFTPTNYVITYVDGALTVTPLPLTVTASNVTKVFGETPTLSLFTTTPLANGETVSSVTETSPGAAATAPVPGPYAITPRGATGTFTPANYVITYVDGQLLVTPAPIPPIIVPPVVVVPPVEPPIVVIPPVVVVPPIVVLPPGASPETPVLTTGEVQPVQTNPLELGPEAPPGQPPLPLVIVGTGVTMPPVPPPALVPPVRPPAVVPPVVPPAPPVAAPPAQPPLYVPPQRPRKPDRN